MKKRDYNADGKIPGWKPFVYQPIKAEPIFKPSDLIPCRHVCGEIVYAALESEYPLFYNRVDPKGAGRSILSCPRCDSPLNMDWMRKLYLVEPMPYATAVRTMSRVCSNCWGWELEMSGCIPTFNADDNLTEDYRLVTCKKCGVETRGYVTQRYVGYAREQDSLDYGRAITGLAEALELEQEGLPIQLPTRNKLTEHGNLAMLGF